MLQPRTLMRRRFAAVPRQPNGKLHAVQTNCTLRPASVGGNRYQPHAVAKSCLSKGIGRAGCRCGNHVVEGLSFSLACSRKVLLHWGERAPTCLAPKGGALSFPHSHFPPFAEARRTASVRRRRTSSRNWRRGMHQSDRWPSPSREETEKRLPCRKEQLSNKAAFKIQDSVGVFATIRPPHAASLQEGPGVGLPPIHQ